MSGKPTFGTVVKIGATSTPSVTLTNVTDIDPPKTTRDAVDITVHDSASGTAEFMADGVTDPGGLTIKMNYIAGDANDLACLAAYAAGDYYFQYNSAATTGNKTFTSKGVVISYGQDARGVKGKATATMTVKLSGPMTVA